MVVVILIHVAIQAKVIEPEKVKLGSGFLNPPPQARPHTFWIWMNGNIVREGITDDLEAMERI